MNDQTTNTPAWEDEEHETRREARRDSAPWLGGLILIIIGVVFLLQNLNVNIPFFNNWWALFILIPAVSSFSNGMAEYRQAGALNERARGKLIAGFFLTVLAFALLIGINWSLFWPLILIAGGVSVLVNNLWK